MPLECRAMSRPVPPNAPTPPQSAAQKIAAQQNRKAPAAPPVYRPQPVPKVLQRKSATRMPVNTPPHVAAPHAARTPFPHAPHAQSAAPKTFGVKPPQPTQSNAARPTQPHAARPNQRTPVNPFKQPQTPSRVLQCKPAEATRAGILSHRQAPPHVHTRDARTQPRTIQPKTAASHEVPPRGAVIMPSRLPPAPSGGVVQLAKKVTGKRAKPKTRSRVTIVRGTDTSRITKAKKLRALLDTSGRIMNVRSNVRGGNKKGRQSTTKHKTTDTSNPINSFLKSALKGTGINSRIVRMEGGHCVADVYGGSLCLSNTVPLPHAFNTISYKKEETSLKKTLPTTKDTTMEVSVEYPKNPLKGFLSDTEQNKLKRLVTTAQYEKLEDLFSNVPTFMAWEVNTSGGGHSWIEFHDIRNDIWPRGHKPKNVLTKEFINAVKNL
jgi:hypothetical protein